MSFGQSQRGRSQSKRLFFEVEDLPRIRSNARTILLGPKYQEWEATSPQAIAPAWAAFEKSGSIVHDLRDYWAVFTETALVHIVEPTVERKQALLDGFENVIGLPKWDYMMDGDEDIGLMRASMAISRLLFAREALGEDFPAELNERFLEALVVKGAIPCLRTIEDMNAPDQVVGWRFDPGHPKIGDYSLERWPYLFGHNNLRGTATMGLGLAALALEGRDERTEAWLEAAVGSAQSTFKQFTAGGSYSEGLSYGAYAMRLLLPFCEAHHRLKGTTDWTKSMNWAGFTENVAAMQMGEKADGTPDVVNFSDASGSIHPCVGSWIQQRTGNLLGQYAAKRFAVPGFFLDFLWYRPEQRSVLPSETLHNYRDDLEWLVSRSGWRPDDAALAFRSGMPSNHEHADRNSFIYKIYGERLLNDPFGAAYDRGDPKWTLRLTKAHNAVLIGGKGHQYHHGEEGVNEGKAEAKIVSYIDKGRLIQWSSDATQGYKLVNDNVSKVLRTVVFAKPNVVIVLDQVDLLEGEEKVEVRFFPDNRDGAAELTLAGDQFLIKRPRARLHGITASRVSGKLDTDELDFKDDLVAGVSLDDEADYGVFPFVRLESGDGVRHELLSVMVSDRGTTDWEPELAIAKTGQGWRFTASSVSGNLNTEGNVPKLELDHES